MAVCKTDGYDLLNPPNPADFCKTPHLSPPLHRKLEWHAIHEGIAANWGFCLSIHKELANLFASKPEYFNFNTYTIGDRNIIRLVHMQIKQLAFQDHLDCLSSDFKKDFVDCFPADIPYIDSLPTNVYHYILVLSGTSFSTTCPYSCLHKYCYDFSLLQTITISLLLIAPTQSLSTHLI